MGDVDPLDPTMFYTGYDAWKYDTNVNQWIFQAITHNRFKYPQDSRVIQPGFYGPYEVPQNIWARRLKNGNLYLFMNSMAGDQGPLRIYRFNKTTDGYIAIPSARWGVSDGGIYPPNQPAKGVEYVWHDSNGNGKYDTNEFISNPVEEYIYRDGTWVDKDGNLWTGYRNAGIRRLKLSSFDGYNNPVYSFIPREWFMLPIPVTDSHFIRYMVDSDTMYIAGQTTNNHANNDQPANIWTMLRYDNWLNISGSLTFKWETPSQYYTLTQHQTSWDVFNEYIFTIGLNNDHNLTVWSVNDGSLVTIISPPSFFGGPNDMGWCDIWDSSIRANQLKNGSYIIFVEEDGRNKVIQYTYNP
eukprot:129824_1